MFLTAYFFHKQPKFLIKFQFVKVYQLIFELFLRNCYFRLGLAGSKDH